MPNRIIRESILTSERVEELDPASEVFYRRLLSKVDDYGRYDARPSILRASLYPLRVDRVREADCTRWIAICEMAGLIALYQHDGKPFLAVANTGWQVRSPSKYPEPLQTPANICAQVQTNARLDVDVDVGVVVENQKRAGRASPPVLPDWLPPEAWADWHGFRNARKGWTAKARELSLRTLADLKAQGHDPRKVIEQSIERGWTGLFPIKSGPVGFVPATPPHRPGGTSPTVTETAESKRAAQEAFDRSLREFGYAK